MRLNYLGAFGVGVLVAWLMCFGLVQGEQHRRAFVEETLALTEARLDELQVQDAKHRRLVRTLCREVGRVSVELVDGSGVWQVDCVEGGGDVQGEPDMRAVLVPAEESCVDEHGVEGPCAGLATSPVSIFDAPEPPLFLCGYVGHDGDIHVIDADAFEGRVQ